MLYNETATTLYKRSHNITFNNDLGQIPRVTFHEQYATVEGVAIDGRAGSCYLEMPEDPTEEFALVHPLTGESLGTTSFLNLQVIMHSLYLHTADIRDNPPEPEPAPEPEPEPAPEPEPEPTEEEPTDGTTD